MVMVVKATGEKQAFSKEKVRNSIIRAGIPQDLQKKVLEHVEKKLYENIPTSEIYHHIIEFLGTSVHPYSSSRYSLKQAIMDLGPTGYPFEDYVARILKEEGYETKVRQIVNGTCITHEIDVVAEKDGKKVMVEAKFHNSPGTRSDVHVALYTKARFDDVKDKNSFDQAYLITNTKATMDAFAYGNCMGMTVIGWSYPEGESLRDLVERYYLIPITTLTTIPLSFKQRLLENHIVLCRDICSNSSLINSLELPEDKKHAILSEAEFVCKR